MRVLAIDTSSSVGSVALLDDAGRVTERSLGAGTRHSRDLLPSVDAVLGGDPRGTDLLALGAGPGSFTGLRIAVAFAKTYCTQTGTPAVTVSSLDVIARNVEEFERLCVVVDARLSQVYAAMYGPGWRKEGDDFAATPDEVAEQLDGRTLVVGSGLRRYRAAFAGRAAVCDDATLWQPRAGHAARLGLARFNLDGGDDPAALKPRYLRRPQAEVKWEQSQNASGPR